MCNHLSEGISLGVHATTSLFPYRVQVHHGRVVGSTASQAWLMVQLVHHVGGKEKSGRLKLLSLQKCRLPLPSESETIINRTLIGYGGLGYVEL